MNDRRNAAIPAFSWRGSLSPLLIVPASVPILSALFAPEDVLSRWQHAKRLTEVVQSLLPFADATGHARSTDFFEVAAFSDSLAILSTIFMAIVWTFQTMLNYPILLYKHLQRSKPTLKKRLLFLVSSPIMLAAWWALITIPGDPAFAPGLTTHSRVGFAIVLFCAVYSSSATLGAQLLMLRLFFDSRTR